MKYKVRVFDKKTNEEKWTVEETFETEKAADDAIIALKNSFSQDYIYVKVPVKK
jgi:hypothetical protein